MRIQSVLLLTLTVAATVMTAGCQGNRSTSGKSDNNLHLAMTTSPTTFDPAMVQDGPTIDLLQQIFESLVQWTPENKLAPALAESWDVSKDGLTYTFHLRKNVKFQDGSTVTAQDFYNSMRRALDPKLQSPVAVTYLGDITGAEEVAKGKATDLKGVKVIDANTLAVTIKKPKAYWIYTLTYPTAYAVSKAVLDKATGELKAEDVEKGAGTGAFKLSNYEIERKVTLVANKEYWGGAPHIDGQDRPIVKDASTRHSLYINGQLDIVDEGTGDLEADKNDARLKDQIKYFLRASTFYIALNRMAFPPFQDVRVRQALAYATDKKKIIQVAYGGNVTVAEDILPEGIPGYDLNFKGIPYDPAKAKALLAEAGYPGGKGFPVLHISYRESYPVIEKTVDLVRQMWGDNLGIQVQGDRLEWSVLLQKENNKVMPSYHVRWAADYLDPQDFYTVLFHTGSSENNTSFNNPTYDAICDKADSLTDEKQRQTLYRQAARIVADQVPVIPLYYQRDVELVNPRIKNLDDGLMGHLPYKHVSLGH